MASEEGSGLGNKRGEREGGWLRGSGWRESDEEEALWVSGTNTEQPSPLHRNELINSEAQESGTGRTISHTPQTKVIHAASVFRRRAVLWILCVCFSCMTYGLIPRSTLVRDVRNHRILLSSSSPLLAVTRVAFNYSLFVFMPYFKPSIITNMWETSGYF